MAREDGDLLSSFLFFLIISFWLSKKIEVGAMAEDAFYMEKGWKEVLREEFDQPYMKQLQAFLPGRFRRGTPYIRPGT